MAVAVGTLVVVAVVLVLRRPRAVPSWVLVVMAAGYLAALVMDWLGRSAGPAFAATFPLLPVLIAVFPDGPRGRAGRLLVASQLVALTVVALGFTLWADPSQGPLWFFRLEQAAMVWLLISAVLATAQLVRWQARMPIPARRQVRVFLAIAAATCALYVVVLPVGVLLGQGGALLDAVVPPFLVAGLPLAVAAALLHDGTVEGRLVAVLRWTVVLTPSLAAAAVVALLVAWSAGQPAPPALPLVAAVVVVVLLQPWLARVVRGPLRRLLTGEPASAAALRSLAERLAGTVPPQAVPGLVAEAVGEVLQAQRVVVEVGDAQPPAARGSWGSGGQLDLSVDLDYAGERVGRLQLSPGPRPLAVEDLHALLPVIAPPVAASRYALEVERSHGRLRSARQDERDRLRADLHDELMPALAGMRMLATAAADRLEPSAESRRLLGRLEADAGRTGEVVRRILVDLRPSSVEDAGLVAAVRERAHGLTVPGRFVVEVTAEELPPLPPDSEVALYRVAAEALANAARHSGGRHCRLRLSCDDEDVVLSVRDDGHGLPAQAVPGIGLRSMRERVAAVGGRLDMVSSPAEGTEVVARVAISRRQPANAP